MAKLRTIKGKSKIKIVPKRKTNDTAISWGVGCKPETCYTVFKSCGKYLLACPLIIMGKPDINCFDYVMEGMLGMCSSVVMDRAVRKFNAEIVIVNSEFKYLRFPTEQDARKCKNFFNKFLRELN